MPKFAACLAIAVLLAVPATAAATDYCVAPNTACGGTNVATFQAAIDAADDAANADRIFLGAAVYTAPTTAGFNYDAPTFPVEIVGAGRASTELTAPSAAIAVMTLEAGRVRSSAISRLPCRRTFRRRPSRLGCRSPTRR
jgi:pectin methylesterase-like acyl-CoA thioesterase